MISGTIELASTATVSKGVASAGADIGASSRRGMAAFRHLLAATDGNAASDGALRLADLIAGRDGASVAVLSVLDPEARTAVVGALLERVEQRFATLRGQVGIVVGARPSWHAAIDIGSVGETISRIADTRASELIVVGFGHHRRSRDRTPDKATVRRIAELSPTPVLVVPSDTRTLPKRTMLALDFSRASIRAGRAAVRIMGATNGVVHLVYVHTSYEPFPAAPVDPDPTYAAGFAAFFDAVERELCAPPGITFEHAVIQRGDPVSELLAYAAANGLELIAVGNHGKAEHERLPLGSVSTGILRSAQCMVLVSGTGAGGVTDTPTKTDIEVPLRGSP